MIAFGAFCVSLAIVGCVLAQKLWTSIDGAGGDTNPAERLVAGTLAGIALWVAFSWCLALTGQLDRAPLLIAACAVMAAAAFIVARKLLKRPHVRVPFPDGISIAALVPLGGWIVYVLWRGSLLPPCNHDALSYHFPKAVFMMRAHGFRYFDTPDGRMNAFPANYELLLSDLLLLTGSDRLSEWINAAAYVLFLVSVAAVAQRWWGKGRHTTGAVIATAFTPVLLLHSGADKNDLLTVLFCVWGLLWISRWYAGGGRVPWVLAILSFALAAGTKASAAAVFIACLPFIAYRVIANVRRRQSGAHFWTLTILASVAAFFLLGCIVYPIDVVHAGSVHATTMPTNQSGPLYGDWANLWQYPYLLLTVPFSQSIYSVWVPWHQQAWFWPRYELFFSHYGKLVSILTCILPLCVYRYRVRREQLVFTAGAILGFLLTVPIVHRPRGYFATDARFLSFVVVAIVCWTVAPLVRELEMSSKRAAAAAIAALSLMFVFGAFEFGMNDTFAPWDYVRVAAREGGTRRVWVHPWRACFVIDRMAGLHDVVAVDGTTDIWIYPAMGASLSRPIVFIAPGPGPVRVPPAAQWVMVDRSWTAIRGNPKLTDMGQYWRYVWKGQPSADDLRVVNALSADPQWELVYWNRQALQAVFHRKRR